MTAIANQRNGIPSVERQAVAEAREQGRPAEEQHTVGVLG
jgi:hypothetical protein